MDNGRKKLITIRNSFCLLLNEPDPYYFSCELNIGEQEMYEQHIRTFKPEFMDQHIRYPADKKTGGYSYQKIKDSHCIDL